MAIGTFANLAPAQLQLAQSRQASGDLLGNILQSLQTGAALGNFPQQIQQDRLAQQLNNAILAQRLQELQNPEQALARKIQQELTIKGALNPDLGIRAAEPGLLGQTIGAPSAISQTEDQLNAALALNPQLTLPSAIAGAPETPISVFGINTGLTQNPNIPINAQQRKQAAEIAKIEARYKAAGVPTRQSIDVDGNVTVIPTRIFDGVAPIGTQVLDKDGKPIKEAPKPTKGSGGGALTENAKLIAFRKASEQGIDTEDPKYLITGTQTPNFTQIVIDTGKASRENKRLEDAAKAGALTGDAKKQLSALNAAEKQLHTLQNEIMEISRSGNTPGFADNMIAAELSAPPTGGLSSAFQQTISYFQSDESKNLEDRKAVVASGITKAISGLAVSKDEARRLGFLPRAGESFQELMRKAANLEDYINNQREGITGSPVSSPVATPGINPNAANPVQPTGLPRIISITPSK